VRIWIGPAGVAQMRGCAPERFGQANTPTQKPNSLINGRLRGPDGSKR